MQSSIVSGTAEQIALSVAGLPAEITASFNPSSIAAGAHAVLTLTSVNAPGGTVSFTVTGSAPSDTETATASAVVASGANTFAIAVAPASQPIAATATVTYVVQTTVTGGTAESVSLSVGGLPTGLTGAFSPNNFLAGGTSTLTLTSSAASLGDAPFTVTGTATSDLETANADVVVSANDFTLKLAPLTRSIAPGGSATFAVDTAIKLGAAESIYLTVDGLPASVTPAFDNSTIQTGGPSTLTLSVDPTAAPAAAQTFTVTAISASQVTHLATGTLTIGGSSTVTAPADGATVSGAVQLTATATVGSNTRLARIDFYVDAAVVGTGTTSPASVTWQSSSVTDGVHAITVRAYDAAGGETTSTAVHVTVANTAALAVQVSAPSSGASVSGTVALTAVATGSITAIALQVDGTSIATGAVSPFTAQWDSRTVGNGPHTVTAQALGAGGQVSSSPLSITVANSSRGSGGCNTGPGGFELLSLLGLGALVRGPRRRKPRGRAG